MPTKRQQLTTEEFTARLADGATLRNIELRDAELSGCDLSKSTFRDWKSDKYS